MKFTNLLKEEKNKLALRNALMNWALNTDGYNGRFDGILYAIPWTDEMDKIIPWKDVHNDFDIVINDWLHCDWRFKVVEIITDSVKRSAFMSFIDNRLYAIINIYDKIIEKLNNRSYSCELYATLKTWHLSRQNNCKAVIERFTHTDDNGFDKYEIVDRIYADTKYDAICDIWNRFAYTRNIWKNDFGRFCNEMYKGVVSVDNVNGHFVDCYLCD